MTQIEEMKAFLANMDCDDWERVRYDTRENLYEAAWQFWCANATPAEIRCAYEEIKA